MFEVLDQETLAKLATLVLTIVASVLGPKLRKYVKKYKVLAEAAEDGEITPEELKKIKKAMDKL